MKKYFFIILALALTFSSTYAFFDDQDEMIIDDELLETTASILSLKSKCAILYDKTYKLVLYEKNAHTRTANASTTKILTAIVAYENGDLDSVVTISKEAASVGGSVIDLKSGDQITLGDLLKGLLVHSGNDAAYAIAEHIAGDVDDFCQMMNEKAKSLGLNDTNFVTPHGLDREEHYTTAYDLAKMAEYLLNIEYLAQIVASSNVNIKVNGQVRNFNTTNEMLSIYNGANGVKTGYTGDAGRCLVTSASRDERTLICVVLGCETKNQRTLDSKTLLDFGFANFKIIDICENMQKQFEFRVKKAKEDRYIIKIEKHIYLPLNVNNSADITYNYEIYDNLTAPLLPNTEIGKITIILNGKPLKTLVLRIKDDISSKSFTDYLIKLSKKQLNSIEIKL